MIKGIETHTIKAPGSTSRCPKLIKKMFKCSRLLKKKHFKKSQFCKPLDKSMNIWPIKACFDGTDLFFLTSNKERKKPKVLGISITVYLLRCHRPLHQSFSLVRLSPPSLRGVRPCLTVCVASPFYSSRLTTPFRSYLFHLPTSFTSSFSHSLPAAVVLSVSHLSLPAETSSAVAFQLFGFWN